MRCVLQKNRTKRTPTKHTYKINKSLKIYKRFIPNEILCRQHFLFTSAKLHLQNSGVVVSRAVYIEPATGSLYTPHSSKILYDITKAEKCVVACLLELSIYVYKYKKWYEGLGNGGSLWKTKDGWRADKNSFQWSLNFASNILFQSVYIYYKYDMIMLYSGAFDFPYGWHKELCCTLLTRWG